MLILTSPVDESLMEKSFPDCTVCELLRLIYKKTDDENIRMYCRIGVSMGKNMDVKMRSYKENWSDGFWDKTENKELKAHLPCSLGVMEVHYPDWTLCETIRQIYHATDDNEIRTMCRVGVTMAKAMDNALKQYKARATLHECA